MVSIANTSGSD